MSDEPESDVERRRSLGQYLGDAVYIRNEEYRIVLFTHNGVYSTNSIYLEPDVARSLKEYLNRIMP